MYTRTYTLHSYRREPHYARSMGVAIFPLTCTLVKRREIFCMYMCPFSVDARDRTVATDLLYFLVFATSDISCCLALAFLYGTSYPTLEAASSMARPRLRWIPREMAVSCVQFLVTLAKWSFFNEHDTKIFPHFMITSSQYG